MARVAQLRSRFVITQLEIPVDVTLVAHVRGTDPYCTRKVWGLHQENSHIAYRVNPDESDYLAVWVNSQRSTNIISG